MTTNPWKPTNRMTDDTVMHDAIGKIREASDKRREVEAHVLAENNLASVRQLSEDKKKKFCAIVDALLAEQADVNTQLFPENDQALIDAASQIKTTTWGTITEGTEDLQELSTGTLQSYKKKARTDVGQRVLRSHDQAQTDWKGASVDRRKVAKRVVGIHNASERLNKEEIMEAILEMEGLYIDQLTESGLEKLEAIAEQVMIDEGILATGLAAAAGVWGAHKINQGLKSKKFNRAISGRKEAAKRAADLDHPIRKAQMQSRSLVHGKASSDQGMSRFVSRLNAKNKYDDIAKGKPGLRFGTRKEEIVEAILEMEGLDSIDQLSESGLEKLEAIVEQVLLDEEENEKKKLGEGNLQELSKGTLARYIVKAHRSGTAAAADQENAFMRGAKRNKDKLRKAGQTGEKREQGIERAAHKLYYKKEDVDDLQELSKGTLRNYVDTAHRNGAQHSRSADWNNREVEGNNKLVAKIRGSKTLTRYQKGVRAKVVNRDTKFKSTDAAWHERKAENRTKGISMATRKLAKNEAYEPRGERDVGDKKQPTGVPNKKVDAATLADRKLVKRNGGRFPDNNSY